MTIRIASLGDIPGQDLPGRQLKWLVTPETLGAQKISIAIMNCPEGSVVRPLHSHIGTEEILLILQGQGEAWVDGEVTPFKQWDAVLLPADSKHMVRNTGSDALITASIFSPSTNPDSYRLYEANEGW